MFCNCMALGFLVLLLADKVWRELAVEVRRRPLRSGGSSNTKQMIFFLAYLLIVFFWQPLQATQPRKRMDPCFGFKSSLSFEIMSFVRNPFFENFCFLFKVLSFRVKCFLFV